MFGFVEILEILNYHISAHGETLRHKRIIEHGINEGLAYDKSEIDNIIAFAGDHEDFEETVKLIHRCRV